MAPISSSSARRQVRCCTNTGAKVRMREAKQAGRCMAASLGGDVPVYRSPAPPPRPRRALRRCHACPEWPKSREGCVAKGALVHTDEYDIYARLEDWGYGHKT